MRQNAFVSRSDQSASSIAENDFRYFQRPQRPRKMVVVDDVELFSGTQNVRNGLAVEVGFAVGRRHCGDFRRAFPDLGEPQCQLGRPQVGNRNFGSRHARVQFFDQVQRRLSRRSEPQPLEVALGDLGRRAGRHPARGGVDDLYPAAHRISTALTLGARSVGAPLRLTPSRPAVMQVTGTTLGAAYQARAHYLDRERFTNVSKAVADVIAYANSTTGSIRTPANTSSPTARQTAKSRFPTTPWPSSKMSTARPILLAAAMADRPELPAPTPSGIPVRFQTEPTILPIVGPDYFNVPASNDVYNRGPIMNLIDSPSFPSGHTTYGYMGSILLAVMVPDRYQEMIARGAEYGNDRIIIGAHYAMDVLGGRTLATYDLAHLLANDPAYMNRPLRDVAKMTATSQPQVPEPISDFRAAVATARADLTKALEVACGDTVAACARQDTGRFNAPAMNEAFYATTQTYGLAIAHPEIADKVEDVGALAPEAGNLLTAPFPKLTLEEANRILTETEGPGGGFLDNGSAFGVYSRLNLYAAAGRAAALSRAKP